MCEIVFRVSSILLAAFLLLAARGSSQATAAGCDGYSGNGKPSTQRVVSIVVTAQSGNVSHTSALNVTVQ